MGYIDVSAEVKTFLFSLLLGAVLCLMYDIVRALHKVSVNGFFEVIVSDLLFWFFAAMITFGFLVLRCQGNIRAYVLVIAAVGFIAVRLTVSKLFMQAFVLVFKAVSRLFNAFFGLIGKSISVIEEIIQKSYLNLKKGLQHKVKLLYNDKRKTN